MFLLYCIGLVAQGIGVVVSYVTNNAVFPKPLSAKEEAKLLDKMAEGCDVARSTLIERNLRLVAHVVKKYDNGGEDLEDLISIGTIGLIKAIKTFKTEKGARLATYAARCIDNEVLMHFRASKRTKTELMLEEPIGADGEGNEISLMDIICSDEADIPTQVELMIDQECLESKVKLLSPREQQVLCMRYGLNLVEQKTQQEIGKLLGISRSYVSRIEKRALAKLQQEMG